MREMKTIHFNAETQLRRLVFFDPYDHKDNIFNQVGIIQITAIGESLEVVQKGTNLLSKNYGEPVDLNNFKNNKPYTTDLQPLQLKR